MPVFRFRNDSDIVPHVPLGIVFRHVGELAFIDGAGHLHRNLTTTMKAMLDPGVPLMSAREARTIQQLMRTGAHWSSRCPAFWRTTRQSITATWRGTSMTLRADDAKAFQLLPWHQIRVA